MNPFDIEPNQEVSKSSPSKRPERQVVINNDDILNVQILTGTSETIDDFINKL